MQSAQVTISTSHVLPQLGHSLLSVTFALCVNAVSDLFTQLHNRLFMS